MKVPATSFTGDASAIAPLLTAAWSEHHVEAVHVLFMHPTELHWRDPLFGGFMSHENEYTDGVDDALDLLDARAKLGGKGFMRLVSRTFGQFVVKLFRDNADRFPDLAEGDRAAVLGAMAAKEMNADGQADRWFRMASESFDPYQTFHAWAAVGLVRANRELRRRACASHGWEDDDYHDLVLKLRSLGVLRPAVRVSFDVQGRDPEITLSALHSAPVADVAPLPVVEICRLDAGLWRLIDGGENMALSVFVAEAIDRGVTTHGRQERWAYASARYGNRDGPEVDVAVPALATAIEVKVYRAPALFGTEQVDQAAARLGDQLKLRKSLGFNIHAFVTNLETDAAAAVAAKAAARSGLAVDAVHVFPGPQAMVEYLRQMILTLDNRGHNELQVSAKPAMSPVVPSGQSVQPDASARPKPDATTPSASMDADPTSATSSEPNALRDDAGR